MPRAILFDLFNTLVPGATSSRRDVLREIAADLSIDPVPLGAQLKATWRDRMTGKFGDTTAQLRTLLARLGIVPFEAPLAVAVARHIQYSRVETTPEPMAVHVLAVLRAAGWRIAIVSNCTADAAQAVRHGAFTSMVDAFALSYDLGIAKPDPAIYRTACSALGFDDPAGCVYVGDGADHELEGAANLGMHAIQTTQYAQNNPSWAGQRVASLAELLPILNGDVTP